MVPAIRRPQGGLFERLISQIGGMR